MPTIPGEHRPPGNSSQPPSDEICSIVTLNRRLAFGDPHYTLAEAEKASFCLLH